MNWRAVLATCALVGLCLGAALFVGRRLIFQHGAAEDSDGRQSSAASAYEVACALRDPSACYNLGIQYRFGEGVQQDLARAAELYRRACDGNVFEACTNLGGTTFTYWWRVGFPVLLPSLLGGFMLLFANSFSAYATAKILTDNTKIVSLRLSFYLGGDVNVGQDAIGFALAAWMILITAFAMIVYWRLRKKAERWQQ